MPVPGGGRGLPVSLRVRVLQVGCWKMARVRGPALTTFPLTLLSFHPHLSSPLLVIPPTWEEGGQNESAEFLGGVVRNGTLSQESLFNFEEKFEKLYNRVPPRDTVLDLSKCKMETTQKRMASIKNTLSGYYRRFGVPVSPFALVQLSLI